MYAVIFRAVVRELDSEYSLQAERMRELALNEYGCLEFISYTQGRQEVAISYWDNEVQIRNWKENAEHQLAQEKGRSQWYESYTVEVVEVVRSYSSAP